MLTGDRFFSAAVSERLWRRREGARGPDLTSTHNTFRTNSRARDPGSIYPRRFAQPRRPQISCSGETMAVAATKPSGTPASITIPATPAERNLLSAASAWIPPLAASGTLRNAARGGEHCITAGDLAEWRGQHPSDPLRPPAGVDNMDKGTLKNYRYVFQTALSSGSLVARWGGELFEVLAVSRSRSFRRCGKGTGRSLQPLRAGSHRQPGPGARWGRWRARTVDYPTPAFPERVGQLADPLIDPKRVRRNIPREPAQPPQRISKRAQIMTIHS